MAYGSHLMSEADGVAVGGAIDFSRRVAFYDITPAGTINFVSSSTSDTTVQIQVAGRDSTGVIQTPAAVSLTGTTPVARLAVIRTAAVRRCVWRVAKRTARRPSRRD